MTNAAVTQCIKAYKALPKDQQRILEVLSVVYEPINQTTLKRVLQQLKWTSKGGGLLANLVARPLKETFLGTKLVIPFGNLWMCNPDIVEMLTQSKAVEGDYKEIALAANEVVPVESPGLYGYFPGNNRYPLKYKAARYLRHALYSSDFDALSQLLNVKEGYQALDENEADTLRKMVQHTIGNEWFVLQTDALQLLILGSLLRLSGIYQVAARTEYKCFCQLMQKAENQNRSLIHLGVEQKLVRGDLDGVAAWLEGDSSSQGLSLQGWYQYLLGQYDEAVRCFNDALKVKRKETGKRNVYIAEQAGVFFLLSLFQRNTLEDHKLLRECLKMAPKAPGADLDPFLPVMALVGDAAFIAKGESSLEASHLFYTPYLGDVDQAQFVYLIHDVALYWLGEKDKIQSTDNLSKFCLQAYKNGYLWYAYEYAFLLDKLGKTGACQAILDEANQQAGFKPLVSLRLPTEPWMRALDVLKHISEPTNSGLSEGNLSADLRMVWWLAYAEEDQDIFVDLVPREQKRTKQGTWSKGRIVSLKRLYEELETFDYLTPQDQAICRTIEKTADRGYYGYTDYSYHLPDEALYAAIGHPRIFWDAEASEWTAKRGRELKAIEITKGEPELFVTEQNQHVNIEISPNPAHELSLMDNVVLRREGTHRLCLVRYSHQHVRIASILGDGGLQVPLDAKTRALESIAAVAPILTIHSNVEGHSLAAESVDVDPRIHVHLQPIGDGFQVNLYVQPFTGGGPLFKPGQGGITVFAEVEGKRLQTTRDLQHEKVAVDQLVNQCPELSEHLDDNEWYLDDLERALEVLVYLQSLGDAVVVSWPQGKALKLTREMSPEKMSVSIRKKRDWLEINGELKVDQDNTIAMERLLELMDASPGRFVRLDDDSILVLTKGLRKRLGDLQAYTDGGRFHLLASHAIEDMTDGMKIKSSKQWKEQLSRFNETQQMTFKVPSTLQAELRDYQIEGFQWLARLAHWGAGACLADDMGLGKTLQSLALILTRAPKGPTLVLAPTSVCYNWREEAVKFTPTLKPQLFGGSQRQAMLADAGAFDLVICSYGLLQTEIERLGSIHWHTIVADEAQAIKNPQAKRTKAAMALNGDFKIITTGTPIENHLGELWSLFRFINPGLLGSLERFNKRFASAIENDNDAASKEQLRRLTKPFILRRVKSDVLTELPPRTDITIHVELSQEEAAFYEALRRQAIKRMEQPDENKGQQKLRIFAELMKLRRACCNPNMVMPDANIASSKLNAFGEIVGELLENRHKALVFSQFVGHLDLIRQYLDKKQIAYQYLDGSTPVKQRKTAVDAFQAGEGDLFLISLKAGGVGLNLTAADYVIHMDPWWNPAVEDQASDRAHRLGQQRPVTVYRLVTSNTIEDKIVALHHQKRDLANSLLEGTESTGKMSVEDMMQLIEG